VELLCVTKRKITIDLDNFNSKLYGLQVSRQMLRSCIWNCLFPSFDHSTCALSVSGQRSPPQRSNLDHRKRDWLRISRQRHRGEPDPSSSPQVSEQVIKSFVESIVAVWLHNDGPSPQGFACEMTRFEVYEHYDDALSSVCTLWEKRVGLRYSYEQGCSR
jgi:hypothetical protein